MKVIVGTGWWSNKTPHRWIKGTSVATQPAFFGLWLRQVLNNIRPQRIIVTDSCAPEKPSLELRRQVVWVELDRNYGHANDIRTGHITTKYCGATRAILNGATYALCCDADLYIYVEQDCVVYGRDFVRQAIADSDFDIYLGARTKGGKGLFGGVAAPMLQESVIVVRRQGLERFISSLILAEESDGQLPPEVKKERDLFPFGILSVPFGRSRPIDFSLPCFYAQHLSQDELEDFMRLEGILDDNAFSGLRR
jgi:hypothetical protein